MKKNKYLILFIAIALIVPSFILAGESAFNSRRQAWLDRNGSSLGGTYYDSETNGRPYIFAWLENGKYFGNGDNHSTLGTLHDQLTGMYGYTNKAGTRAGLSLLRAFYQYGGVLKGDICPNNKCYPNTEDYDDIKSYLEAKSRVASGVAARTGAGKNCSAQPMRTIETFLHTQEDNSAEFRWISDNTTGLANIWISPYSGTTYSVGQNYNTHQYTKDAIYNYMDMCLINGAQAELDGNYTDRIFYSLLTLNDLVNRPLERLNNDSDPEGKKIKDMASMSLDFMYLDESMESSANQHGGAFGRHYKNRVISTSSRGANGYPFADTDTEGETESRGSGGIAYVSDYKMSPVIEDVITLHDEPDNYWHWHMENPGLRNYGKETYVTKYYTIGGNLEAPNNWHLDLKTEGGYTGVRGFKIWLDYNPMSATRWYGDWMHAKNRYSLGSRDMYHYKNAWFTLMTQGDPHLHVIQIDDFDEGQENLVRKYVSKSEICNLYSDTPADDENYDLNQKKMGTKFVTENGGTYCNWNDLCSSLRSCGANGTTSSCSTCQNLSNQDSVYYLNDYKLSKSGWNFFREGKIALAINIGSKMQVFELAIIGEDYSSFDEFKSAILGKDRYDGAEIHDEWSNMYYKTSKGDVIGRGDASGPTINGEPIFNFPFKRMETIYGYGNEEKGNLIYWEDKVMTVEHHNKRCVFDFNDWTTEGNACSTESVFYKSDFNCDGITDIQDFGILLSNWEETENIENYIHPQCENKIKKLNLSGKLSGIGPSDLGILMSCWGAPDKEMCYEIEEE